MRFSKLLVGSLMSAALVAAPFSAALAGWHHHGGGRGFRGPFGIIGALVGGAAAIATAPIAILASGGERQGYERGYSRNGNSNSQSGYYQQAYSYPPPSTYGDRRKYRSAVPPGYDPAEYQADERYFPGDGGGFGGIPDRAGRQLWSSPRSYAGANQYSNESQSAYNDSGAGYGPPRKSQYYAPRGYEYQQQRYAQQPGYNALPPGY